MKNLVADLAKHCEIQFKNIETRFQLIEKRTRNIDIVSALSSRMFIHIMKVLSLLLYEDIIEYSNLIIESIMEMMKGNIPRQLITPKLKNILQHSASA